MNTHTQFQSPKIFTTATIDDLVEMYHSKLLGLQAAHEDHEAANARFIAACTMGNSVRLSALLQTFPSGAIFKFSLSGELSHE